MLRPVLFDIPTVFNNLGQNHIDLEEKSTFRFLVKSLRHYISADRLFYIQTNGSDAKILYR